MLARLLAQWRLSQWQKKKTLSDLFSRLYFVSYTISFRRNNISLIYFIIVLLFTVNNAGTGILTPLECVPIETAKEVFDVNYFGAYRLIQAVLPGMKARQSGLIINNSSHFGIVGIPFVEVYCSSKFALEGLTESMAPILRQFNIRWK